MKKTLLFLFLPVLAIIFFVAAQSPATPDNPELDWPEEITAMLDKACYDCHSSDSRNVKAKTALNFSKYNDLKNSKKLKKLAAIKEELAKNSMPPGKYLKNYPENALSSDEVTTLTNWIDEKINEMEP